MSEFFGHLHPVLVHLPIGMLLLACLFQLLSATSRYRYLRPAVRFTLFWGMVSAVVSCITGYLLSSSADYDELLVSQHQWMGISVAVVAVLYYAAYQHHFLRRFEWLMPALLIVLVSITGHLGGSLTHGSDYLTSAFSHALDTIPAQKPIPNIQEAAVYGEIIQPLLQRKCYSCHGPNKQKGKFRMDQTDALLRGGKDGVVIEPGNADGSELIKRVLLEKADEHHMPPKEKPQLSENEIAVLHWWIANGVTFTKKTKELPQPEKLKPVLLSFQQVAPVKKMGADVPLAKVEPADQRAINRLRSMGVMVLPVSRESNYLDINFVSASRLGDSALQFLRPMAKQVIWLRLNDTQVTDAGMPLIGACVNLTRLQLQGTRVTDKGLAALGGLNRLKSLNLVDTRVTAPGLLPLKNLQGLEQLYVYKTGSPAKDWAALKRLFPKTTIDTGGYTVPLLTTDTTLVKAPVVTK